jgi:hypothetical protein
MERQKATTLTAACQASATAQLPQLNISEREASSLRQHAGDDTTINVEWVVDVADNNLNWFVATAYSIDTVRRVLRVAIPDRDEPTWEGDLPLDPKTIHLLECCDPHSVALYKQCCREGSIKCKWTVEWCIEGAWFGGEALYYGRLANVVYCSDGRNVALHEVTIDENLRLVECLDDSSRGDFEELVVDGIVRWRGPDGDDHELQQDPVNAVARRPARALAHNVEQLDRLATDMAHCLEDALRMRCASDVEQYEAASLLKRHVVCGDLDAADRLDEDGRRDARADLDRRRREAQESCLGAIQRCEGRFWRAAATGLFFRRRYRAGDAVEVALCRGLETCRGVVAKAHDNETYDVDLDGDRPEVGVQIPPEYLRPSIESRQKAQGNLFAGVHDEASESRRRELRSAVADMLREREALRSRLDALTREKEHLEDVIGVQQVSSKPQRRHQGPADRTTRIWCGTIRLGPSDDLGAACAAALPVGTKNEVERAAGFDVVVCALQGEIDGAQCVAALKARLPGAWSNTYVNCGNSHLIVFVRSSAVVKDSVQAVPAPKAAVVCATLRSGARLAFCAVCAGEYDTPLSTDQAVRSARDMMWPASSEDVGRPPLDCCGGADHAFLIGDLGFGAQSVGEAASQELIQAEDWASLANHDELRQSKNEKRALSGWEVSQPRFPPTAHRSCWRERILWRSSPGLVDRVRLELHTSRDIGLGRDAVVAAFSLSPPTKAPTPRPVEIAFPSLKVSLRLEASSLEGLQAAAKGVGPLLVSVDASHDRTGVPPRTSDRGLEADGDSLEEGEPAATSIWTFDDDKKLDSLRTLADPDDDADHITVRVLRRVWREDKQAYEDNGVLIGAALLSGRALARRILRSEAAVDFQEPLLLRGVSIGTLHGSAARAKGRLLTKAAEPLDARMTAGASSEKQKKSWGLFSSKKKLSENYKTRK